MLTNKVVNGREEKLSFNYNINCSLEKELIIVLRLHFNASHLACQNNIYKIYNLAGIDVGLFNIVVNHYLSLNNVFEVLRPDSGR